METRFHLGASRDKKSTRSTRRLCWSTRRW